MTAEKGKRAAYTLEYKLEAVRLVQAGQACTVTAKVLGIPKQTLENWVRQTAKGKLVGADTKPVSTEQMELARLRAELARARMERGTLKKATAYFARESA
jgi:transposase-like protein